MITSHCKSSLLNQQPHMNVLLPIMLNKLFILSVNQFKQTLLLIILLIPHTKHMYHQLTMSGNIIQENMGKNPWIIITAGWQIWDTRDKYINWMKFVLTNSFEQKCVFIHAFLNQGELAAQCSFIGINDEYFDSMCISNAKRLFSETVSPKIIAN